MPKTKKVFTTLFIAFSVAMVLLPFFVSFNDVLVRVVEGNLLYGWVQNNIVPLEAKMIGAILSPLGYGFSFSPSNFTMVVNGLIMEITWNCLGWQSYLLLSVTFLVGLKGKYKIISLIETMFIGILGTFWINILRIIVTVLLAVHAPSIFRIVFHDYLAAFATIVWLFFYWWFCYSYILEEKRIKVLN